MKAPFSTFSLTLRGLASHLAPKWSLMALALLPAILHAGGYIASAPSTVGGTFTIKYGCGTPAWSKSAFVKAIRPNGSVYGTLYYGSYGPFAAMDGGPYCNDFSRVCTFTADMVGAWRFEYWYADVTLTMNIPTYVCQIGSAYVNAAPTQPPVITSANCAIQSYNTYLSYTITATNFPQTYNASGLPGGLSINTTTGEISGMVASNGTTNTYNITIQAGNAIGWGTQTLTLFVLSYADSLANPVVVLTDASIGSQLKTNYLLGGCNNSNSGVGADNQSYSWGQYGFTSLTFYTNGGNWAALGYASSGAVLTTVYPSYGYTMGSVVLGINPPAGTYGLTARGYLHSWCDGYYEDDGYTDDDGNWVGDWEWHDPYSNEDGPYTANITITITTAAQTITFGALANKTYGGAPFTLSATASSGLPITYTSSNQAVATVSGNTVTVTGVGTVTITASQAGNASYSPASATQTFTVAKAGQTITFGSLANHNFGDAPFTLSAVASSGLAVSYAVASGPATLAGNTLTLTGVGTVTITTSQAGNANYNAATNVSQSFTVNSPPPVVTKQSDIS